jgi:toxin-antitoxin system PIN domain toxin
MTSWLPDVNVWLALHSERHEHHRAALAWFNGLDDEQVLVFCRQTQLGLFRLLTTEAVMGEDVRAQRQCWAIYDEWLANRRAILGSEPAELEEQFRSRTVASQPGPKIWADAYLAAFAKSGNYTLVTFDKTLAAKTKDAIQLG